MQKIRRAKLLLLEKVSPKSAAKSGVELWFTPPRYQPATTERLLLEAASKKSVSFGSNGGHYILYRWGRGPIVLIVHGWGGSAAQMTPLTKPLVAAGYQVVAFDALAHGASSGQQTDVLEMAAIVKDLALKLNSIHAIIGHSLGATAAVLAIKEGVKTQKLIVCSAAASMDYYARQFSHALNISRQTMNRIILSINHRMKRHIGDLSLIHLVPTLNLPALILHDKQDEVVQSGEALALSQCWPGSRLVQTTGLGHLGILGDPAAITTMLNYIDKT
jgi:pimeloyl-ACP methyl ester carboxylesterase